jgi:hypothetical protein
MLSALPRNEIGNQNHHVQWAEEVEQIAKTTMATEPPSPGESSVQRPTVAVITKENAAHLEAYLRGLAVCEEIPQVVVVDPSGIQRELAEKTLGDKLHEFTGDLARVLSEQKPVMALVTTSGVLSPPLIQAALDANCHVLSELHATGSGCRSSESRPRTATIDQW